MMPIPRTFGKDFLRRDRAGVGVPGRRMFSNGWNVM
jgi:hypothetical protein